MKFILVYEQKSLVFGHFHSKTIKKTPKNSVFYKYLPFYIKKVTPCVSIKKALRYLRAFKCG